MMKPSFTFKIWIRYWFGKCGRELIDFHSVIFPFCANSLNLFRINFPKGISLPHWIYNGLRKTNILITIRFQKCDENDWQWNVWFNESIDLNFNCIYHMESNNAIRSQVWYAYRAQYGLSDKLIFSFRGWDKEPEIKGTQKGWEGNCVLT